MTHMQLRLTRASVLSTLASIALFLPLAAFASTPRNSPTVAMFMTGGTIQSKGAHRLKLSDYGDARVSPEELLADVPEIQRLANVQIFEISNKGSGSVGAREHLALAKQLTAQLARPEVVGAVVTHGTTALEETAYFLQLTVKSPKPVVVVGAMRPFSAISRDGPLNLYNAVRTAITPEATSKGVMVVLNDTIHSARFVTKSHTYRVETFVARETGPLGYADSDRVVFYRSPLTRHTAASEFDVSLLESLPQVDIVYGYQEASPASIDALVDSGAQGIVLASSASTYREALQRAKEKGVVIVASDRKGAGRVTHHKDGPVKGVITADDINPQKARILLRLALTKTRDPIEIQRMFDEY
jgi:L-asparaginase